MVSVQRTAQGEGELRHPLDPLSGEELARAVQLVRSSEDFKTLSSRTQFISVALLEPPKNAVFFQRREESPRQAQIVLLESKRGHTYEVVVSLDDERVRSWSQIRGVQPASPVQEIIEASQVVKQDHKFREAMARRGITDMEQVQVDPWPAGHYGSQEELGLRLARAVAYLLPRPDDNAYAHPIEGVIALVDLNRMAVLEVEDHGVVPVPAERGNYLGESTAPARSDLRTLEISQPDGPSFQVSGWEVEWQKWHFRVGFTPREGLVLHTVAYEDDGTRRPILYRASLSEMVVPYGDPSPTHYFKGVFDAGENGVGTAVTSLERGCDCLGEIHYFDAAVCDNDGRVRLIRNAICMHEEDYGVLWRHLDWRSGAGEIRRSRRLVVSSFASIGNYDYGFFWYFYQDGTIQFEVKLTGVLSTGAVPPGEVPQYGSLVAPQLNGMIHQHFFNVRLDVMVDGRENSVVEVNSETVPRGSANPHGNAFRATRTLLRREREAQRVIHPTSARSWEIVNPSRRNRLGNPVAYRLIPGENVLPFADPDSAILRRAGFTTKHLWVTPYNAAERFAAGEYPYQHPGGAGLPEWTRADRSIAATDIVVWYTFGHHHLPRPEDWPVMPMAYIGFHLRPAGFFERNPALDVPRPPRDDHCGHTA
jgi:primary-amine oxidase